MSLVDVLDGIPTEPCQLCYVLNISNPAQVNNKSFQRPRIVLLRISKTEARLFYSTAFLAQKPGDINGKFDFIITDRQHFKSSYNLAKSYDMARFAIRAFEIIAVYRTAKNSLTVKKTVLMCCTDVTPKVWYKILLDMALSPYVV